VSVRVEDRVSATKQRYSHGSGVGVGGGYESGIGIEAGKLLWRNGTGKVTGKVTVRVGASESRACVGQGLIIIMLWGRRIVIRFTGIK
jgi:hypothetical protein